MTWHLNLILRKSTHVNLLTVCADHYFKNRDTELTLNILRAKKLNLFTATYLFFRSVNMNSMDIVKRKCKLTPMALFKNYFYAYYNSKYVLKCQFLHH